MNNFLEINFYDMFWWFWIYSFLGWIFECVYSSTHEHRLINRGFVYGPVCTIYGVGALFVILVLSAFRGNIFILFIVGTIITSALEYVVYIILDKIFHQKWWDYSDMRFHYKGILSLESSIAWGILSVLLIKVIHPLINNFILLIDKKLGVKILLGITIVYSIDFLLSAIRGLLDKKPSNKTIARVKMETLRSLVRDIFREKNRR